MGWSRGSQPYVTIDQQGEYLESSFHSNAAVFLAVSQEPLFELGEETFSLWVTRPNGLPHRYGATIYERPTMNGNMAYSIMTSFFDSCFVIC